MQCVFTIDELFEACAVLFGPSVRISLDFLNYLQPEGVKAAYRRKVMSSHPDRALVVGKDASGMNADFVRATDAYQKLHQVVSGNGSISTSGRGTDPSDSAGSVYRPGSGFRKPGAFYNGNLPARKLPFCRFLYYSGLITWKTYIDALVWQRRQRPYVGKLARDLGMLSEKEIRAVLKQRAQREKFGESAIRLGLLTPYKLRVLLGRQRRYQHQIGDYFVQSGILSRRQVERMARQQSMHNQTFRFFS